MPRRHLLHALLLCRAGLTALPALAQRTNENAVVNAGDADAYFSNVVLRPAK